MIWLPFAIVAALWVVLQCVAFLREQARLNAERAEARVERALSLAVAHVLRLPQADQWRGTPDSLISNVVLASQGILGEDGLDDLTAIEVAAIVRSLIDAERIRIVQAREALRELGGE